MLDNPSDVNPKYDLGIELNRRHHNEDKDRKMIAPTLKFINQALKKQFVKQPNEKKFTSEVEKKLKEICMQDDVNLWKPNQTNNFHYPEDRKDTHLEKEKLRKLDNERQNKNLKDELLENRFDTTLDKINSNVVLNDVTHEKNDHPWEKENNGNNIHFSTKSVVNSETYKKPFENSDKCAWNKSVHQYIERTYANAGEKTHTNVENTKSDKCDYDNKYISQSKINGLFPEKSRFQKTIYNDDHVYSYSLPRKLGSNFSKQMNQLNVDAHRSNSLRIHPKDFSDQTRLGTTKSSEILRNAISPYDQHGILGYQTFATESRLISNSLHLQRNKKSGNSEANSSAISQHRYSTLSLKESRRISKTSLKLNHIPPQPKRAAPVRADHSINIPEEVMSKSSQNIKLIGISKDNIDEKEVTQFSPSFVDDRHKQWLLDQFQRSNCVPHKVVKPQMIHFQDPHGISKSINYEKGSGNAPYVQDICSYESNSIHSKDVEDTRHKEMLSKIQKARTHLIQSSLDKHKYHNTSKSMINSGTNFMTINMHSNMSYAPYDVYCNKLNRNSIHNQTNYNYSCQNANDKIRDYMKSKDETIINGLHNSFLGNINSISKENRMIHMIDTSTPICKSTSRSFSVEV